MNNFERGRILYKEALGCFKEAKNAMEERDWNRTIRRAQESVELFLKSILKALNIEFPKVHNVGKFFISALESREIFIEEDAKEQIIRISDELCEKRAPAFYWEKEYTQKEAEQSLIDAEYIREIVEKLRDRIL